VDSLKVDRACFLTRRCFILEVLQKVRLWHVSWATLLQMSPNPVTNSSASIGNPLQELLLIPSDNLLMD
jgi:hypothetical protein